eukprot:SAG25_NODE_578_length_6770_cov_41.318801_10_plen_46_part_00
MYQVWLYQDMALCRFLLADRPAPEARSTSSRLAIQLLFGDPLRLE